MRTFALALCVAGAAAFGTTGHYNNQYAHKGQSDHAHEDHIYGYDSVPQDLDLVDADQDTLLAAIITQVDAANDARKAYLEKIKAQRLRRLEEIHTDNKKKIAAPFEYQERLLQEEEDDILQARNNAIRDSNDAFDDLEWRLDELRKDIVEEQATEVIRIKAALNRAVFDHKLVGNVFHALKIDWLKELDVNTAARTVTPTASSRDFTLYESIFDDFHYDIGHGKGTHEGDIDHGPVVDGYTNRSDRRPTGPVGDYETDVGAQAWAYETPGSRNSMKKRRY